MDSIAQLPTILLLFAVAFCIAIIDRFLPFQFLWVYPTLSDGLGFWLLFIVVDTAMAQWGAMLERSRCILWCCGILFFTAYANYEFLGIALVVWPALLWVVARRSLKRFRFWAMVTLFCFLALAHYSTRFQPGIKEVGWSQAAKLFSLFTFLRQLAWYFSVLRGREMNFIQTMEFFLSPVFWLCPMHMSYLTTDRFLARQTPTRDEELLSFRWILIGILHAMGFSLALPRLTKWFGRLYDLGLWHFSPWALLFLGPALFLLTYLEKARVSYLGAGFLRLQGVVIEPDFQKPWAAKDLLDYWRRFHYWVLEYYMDYFYSPVSAQLCRYFSPRMAMALALFITFSVATTISHYFVYPGELIACIALGIVFGIFTLLHWQFASKLKKLGIPFTWLTVFGLYILAYPVYGLGWSLPRVWQFFLR